MSRMSFADAMDLADALDLPDGAFWAMSHELAGLDYGDGFAEIASEPKPKKAAKRGPENLQHKCATCGKRFRRKLHKEQHMKDSHGEPA